MMYCGNCRASTDSEREDCYGWLIIASASNRWGDNDYEVCPACAKLLCFLNPAFEGLV